jgi:Protein of unknown function (DUF1320)
MTILTIDDLLLVITQEILDDVIEDDETILDGSELVAIGEVNGYLNIRYDITKCYDRNLIDGDPKYSGISTVLQMLTDILLYHAHARVMPDNIPTLREKRYNNAINWLEKVSSGYIAPELPIKDVDPTNPLRYGNSSTTENKYY